MKSIVKSTSAKGLRQTLECFERTMAHFLGFLLKRERKVILTLQVLTTEDVAEVVGLSKLSRMTVIHLERRLKLFFLVKEREPEKLAAMENKNFLSERNEKN